MSKMKSRFSSFSTSMQGEAVLCEQLDRNLQEARAFSVMGTKRSDSPRHLLI